MTSRAPDGLAVIVATRNRSADLERLLEGLTACAPPLGRPWELLVVDNGSTDDTPAVLAAFRGRLPLRALREERAGKSRAVNAGIRAAPQPLLAFTDDDAIVGPSWLRAIERAAGTHADALGFGGRVIPEWAAAPPRCRRCPNGCSH